MKNRERIFSGTGHHRCVWPLIATICFPWGLTSVFVDMMIPRMKSLFDLSYTSALFIRLSFFLAYLFIPIPAGQMIQDSDYKRAIIFGLSGTAMGIFILVPAVNVGSYELFLVGIFCAASGIAMLQVAINPMIVVLGDAKTATWRLTLAQAFNSLGTTIGPIIASVTLLSIDTLSTSQLTSLEPVDQARYVAETTRAIVIFALSLSAILALLSLLVRLLPEPLPTSLKPTAFAQLHEPLNSYRQLVRQRQVHRGMAAVFLYVGAEVTIGSLLINFLRQGSVLGLTASDASYFVVVYWGLAMFGRFVGAVILQRVPADQVLKASAAMTTTLVIAALATKGAVSAALLVAVGFFNSVQFQLIFSLTLRNMQAPAPRVSALLCMSIFGGAVIPMIAAIMADHVSLKSAFAVYLIRCGYCVYFAVTCRKSVLPN